MRRNTSRHRELSCAILVCAIAGCASFFFPRKIVETLDRPVSVTGWDSRGLILDHGGIQPLPDIVTLPDTSTFLEMAISRGIEVQAGGRIIGLVDVHHTCGNDRVRHHVARVDLSVGLVFFDHVDVSRPYPKWASLRGQGSFSRWGLRVEEYDRLMMFQQEVLR